MRRCVILAMACQANVYTRQQDTRALALCESAAIHAWATCCQGGEAAVAGLTAQADQRRRVDFMQKGSMVELCSTSSSGARIQRSKWMAMDATQTALIIGGYNHLIDAGKVHGVRLSLTRTHALPVQVRAETRSSILSRSMKSPRSGLATDQARAEHLVSGASSLSWPVHMRAIVSTPSVLVRNGSSSSA